MDPSGSDRRSVALRVVALHLRFGAKWRHYSQSFQGLALRETITQDEGEALDRRHYQSEGNICLKVGRLLTTQTVDLGDFDTAVGPVWQDVSVATT